MLFPAPQPPFTEAFSVFPHDFPHLNVHDLADFPIISYNFPMFIPYIYIYVYIYIDIYKYGFPIGFPQVSYGFSHKKRGEFPGTSGRRSHGGLDETSALVQRQGGRDRCADARRVGFGSWEVSMIMAFILKRTA